MAAAVPAPNEKPVLPDEQFWKKHSPNQEFPISGLTAVALHVGVAVIVVLLFNFILSSSRDNSMPVELFDGSPDAGGGGDPNASGITNIGGTQRVERASEDEIPKDTPKPNNSMGALPDVLKDLPDLPVNPEANREADAADAKARLDKVAKGTANNPGQSAGKGGPGSGGGQGSGKGAGTGTGDQAGTQGSARQKRNRRWTLSFSTSSGIDYLRQLNALGATLVADFPDGSMRMYRQLSRSPVPAEEPDPQLRSRIQYVDERPTFVTELSQAMGLDRTPNKLIAYFPDKLESEMLKLEIGFRGRREEEIHSTIFRVFLEGERYRLVVSDQKYN